MLWQFRRELIKDLMKDYEVVLGMPFVGHEKDFASWGIRCIETELERRGTNPFKDMKLIRCYNRILDQEKPDMVITYSIKPNVYGGYLCGKKKIPCYVNVQGLGSAFQKKWMRGFVSLLYRFGIRRSKVVFFENHDNASYFLRHHIAKKDRIHVLNGAGVNLDHFAYQPQPEHDRIHFLYLGRIMKEKGMDEIIYSIRRLHQEGYDFEVDLVGFHEEEYSEQINELLLENLIRFHGFQIDSRPYYQEADCILMPSYHEGMSNVNLEAAATGRCVITTNIPGCQEAVDHGKTGMLVKRADAEGLYKAMKAFLELSPEQREQIGIQARKKMEKEFDRKDVIKETISIVKDD